MTRETVRRSVVVSALMSFALGAVSACANMDPGDPGEAVQIAEQEQPLALRSTKLWVAGGTATRARIPVCFLPNVNSSDRARIRAGADAWQSLAGVAGDARYGVEFFGWQSPTAHDVMVQDRVTMTKVSAPASTKMPKYIRFISMGIGRVF